MAAFCSRHPEAELVPGEGGMHFCPVCGRGRVPEPHELEDEPKKPAKKKATKRKTTRKRARLADPEE